MQVSHLGKELKAYRYQNGLTQADLAEKLGVTDKTISKWELGMTSPSKRHLKKLAEVTDIEIHLDSAEATDSKSDFFYTNAFATVLSFLLFPTVIIYRGFTDSTTGEIIRSIEFPLLEIFIFVILIFLLVHLFTLLTKKRFLPFYKKILKGYYKTNY